MNYNNTQFLKEFKTLITNEKESNKIIKGYITHIKDNIIQISLSKPSNLTKNMPIEVNRIKAEVMEIKNKNIKLLVENKSQFKLKQKVSIQNIQKDIIIHKLQETYDNIINNKISKENKETLDILFSETKINPIPQNKRIIPSNLNKNQKKAVINSINSNNFHLIQGPPGTGKTHTIIEIIKQLYEQDNKILITTHTHIALDNILERLNNINKNEVLRIGEKNKVIDNVLEYTLENQIKNHYLYAEIQEKEKLIKKYSKNNIKPDLIENDFKPHENLISKIFNFILQSNENENIIHNPDEKEINQANTDKINELKLEIEHTKEIITEDILKNTKIFASTVLSSSSFLTKDIEYDYVIMDEASQVPVYLALIPLMKTKKFILIGDNKQLQPIQNKNSSYTLNKSIYNLLIEKYPENYTFLNIQYRMNHEISDIASNLYYKGNLLTGEKVKNQKITLKDEKSYLLDDNPITLIDTSNINYIESNVSGGCCNKYEASIILNMVSELKRHDIPLEEIGIITPYKKQKYYIRKLLDENNYNVECDTIYRFQGREKDVIIVSFCKSSNKSLSKFQKKFLADENQLNVSITRSRKKLILVGNFDMINSSLNINNIYDMISRDNIVYLQDIL